MRFRILLIVLLLFFVTTVWAASPDAVALQTGDAPTITVENASQLEQVALLEGHSGLVLALAFSPDSLTLASGGSNIDRTVRLWDVATGTQRALLEGHTAQIAAVGFSEDGTAALSASSDGSIRVWESSSGELLNTIDQTDTQAALGITNLDTYFSADGSRLAYGDNLGYVHVFDLEGRTQIAVVDETSPLYDNIGTLAFSADVTSVALADFDGAIHILNTETGEETGLLQPSSLTYYTTLAFSADGTMLAAVEGPTSNIQLWTLDDGSAGPLLTGHSANPDGTLGVYGLAFSPDGSMLGSASLDGSIRLWDVAGGTQLFAFQPQDGAPVAVAWSPDGIYLASADLVGTVRLWAVPSP